MTLLTNERKTPYPTFQALLREIALALDTKSFISSSAARKLDDSQKDIYIHVDEFEKLKKLTVIDPIGQVFGAEMASRVEIFLRETFQQYSDWMAHHPLDGVAVELANQLFQATRFFPSLLKGNFLKLDEYKQKLCLPREFELTLLNSDRQKEITNSLEGKEVKDRVRSWFSGKDKPSLKYVASLEQHAVAEESNKSDWLEHKWGIIASRFIMSLDIENARGYITEGHSMAFNMFHSDYGFRASNAKTIIQDIFNEFNSKCKSKKTDSDFQRLEGLLSSLKVELDQAGSQLGMDYIYHQFLAKHLVLKGDLEGANSAYKIAFEQALYRAHPDSQIQLIIEEALRVAAYQEKPDKVFITKLKSASILMGWDSLPAKTHEEGKMKIQLVNSNEIDAYRTEFLKYFPEDLAYPSVEYPRYKPKVGLLFEAGDALTDFSLKKKRITVGLDGSLQRKTTPLIYAATYNDFETAQKLIKEGASVNVLSESGDSPLLMALCQLDFIDLFSPMDDRLFNLISECPHSDKVLNTVTRRKMLFPLYAAVETGNPKIVRKILSMSKGIKVDLKGGLDSATPLYNVIGLLMKVQDPKLFEGLLSNVDEETLHRLKPLMAGVVPLSDTVTSKALFDLNSGSDEQKRIFKLIQDCAMEEFNKRKPSSSKLRQIARILIKNGADVNCVHKVKNMEYTPLMLAAETNELQLFKLMLEHGGDWKKTYTLPSGSSHQKKALNCLDIAIAFKATRVRQYIEKELMQ